MSLYFLTFVVCPVDFLQYFSFPSMFVDLVSVYILDFAVTLNDYSHDYVDPRLLNFHHHSELSDSAVVVVWNVRMNVDILAHAI